MPLIAIFGGHSSGLMVAESIDALAAAGNPIRLAGFLNDMYAVGESIGNIPVLGPFEAWPDLDGDMHFIAAFPLPGDARRRHARLRGLNVPPERWATVRDPRAHVSPRAHVDGGCYLAANAVIEHDAVLEAHAIVRAGAYVSHGVRLGEFSFVGPGATLLGRSTVGTGAHIGANAVCREGIRIGDYATVGVGAVVVADVTPSAVVAGNPARELRPA